MAPTKRTPTLESDGNGGSTVSFPRTKPGALLVWLGGGGIITVVIFILTMTYSFGKKTEGVFRDVSTNCNAITEIRSEIEALKVIHAIDEETINKSITSINVRLGPMETNINWIKETLDRMYSPKGSKP